MSGALLFWIIVLDVWSMESQLTTCTSSVVPVFALYFSANCFQKAAVWSLEYSAATSLILVAFFVEPPPPPPAEPAPEPPLQAASASPVASATAVTRTAFVCRDVIVCTPTSLNRVTVIGS